MLEIRKIKKCFGSNVVLNDLSFSIPKGKIFGLIGPNGAGKTTTLRIILNILPPSAGEVLFNNNKLGQEFLNSTGYLPEERGLYLKSKVKNILLYFGQLKGLTKKQSYDTSNYWLNRLDLYEYRNFYLEELSKGNQQKVQFICAIQHDPEVLILDEPFSGFDPVNQSIFRNIIYELKEEKFIILSTHLMDLAESLCDEICLIDNGNKIISGVLKDILHSSDKNIFEVTFAKPVTDVDLLGFGNVNVIEQTGTKVKFELRDILPGQFIKSISGKFDVTEFRKINTTLHQLFLSLVSKKNI